MDSERYTVCRIQRADLDAVAEMWSVMADQHRAYDAEVWCWSDEAKEAWRNELAQRLDSEDTVAMLARDASGDAAGYALGVVKDSPAIFAKKRHAEVWDLLVLPACRGHGVGAMLMDATYAAMKARGAEDVILHVAMENEAALGLYEKLGMRRVMYRMFRKL
jgi:ribosomal protein S18 acetylase RimI-like enzyme